MQVALLGALEVRTGEGKLTEVLSRLPAALAGQVLAACPQVRILATSREPLAITGEALWTVGPLTMRRIPP